MGYNLYSYFMCNIYAVQMPLFSLPSTSSQIIASFRLIAGVNCKSYYILYPICGNAYCVNKNRN